LSTDIGQGEGAGGIALRIEVSQKHFPAMFRERGRKVQRRCRLAHATFLVCDSDYLHNERLE
jgi:hypothetical protein